MCTWAHTPPVLTTLRFAAQLAQARPVLRPSPFAHLPAEMVVDRGDRGTYCLARQCGAAGRSTFAERPPTASTGSAVRAVADPLGCEAGVSSGQACFVDPWPHDRLLPRHPRSHLPRSAHLRTRSHPQCRLITSGDRCLRCGGGVGGVRTTLLQHRARRRSRGAGPVRLSYMVPRRSKQGYR